MQHGPKGNEVRRKRHPAAPAPSANSDIRRLFCYINSMKRLHNAALLFLAMAALLVSCATLPPSRPVENISAEQLKKLLDQNTVLMLVDTRTEYEFRKGRIPGAVNIPPNKFSELATLLPPDKDVLVVFYCRGSG